MNTTLIHINDKKHQLRLIMPLNPYYKLWFRYHLPHWIIVFSIILIIYYLFLSAVIPGDPEFPPYLFALNLIIASFFMYRPSLLFDKYGVTYINGLLYSKSTYENTRIKPTFLYEDICDWYIKKQANQYYIEIINNKDMIIQFTLYGEYDKINNINYEIKNWLQYHIKNESY